MRPSATVAVVPVLDLTLPPRRALDDAAQAIERLRAQGPVLVCCALGYSRSACAAAAWLLATGRAATVDAAFVRIQAARSTSCSTPVMPRCLLRSPAWRHADMSAQGDAEQDTARQLRLCADALHSARSMVVLSTGLSIVAAIGVALAGLVAGTTAIAFWSATSPSASSRSGSASGWRSTRACSHGSPTRRPPVRSTSRASTPRWARSD